MLFNYLKKIQKKIYWKNFSHNPNAIPLLEKNLDKIDWHILSLNPNHFFFFFHFFYIN